MCLGCLSLLRNTFCVRVCESSRATKLSYLLPVVDHHHHHTLSFSLSSASALAYLQLVVVTASIEPTLSTHFCSAQQSQRLVPPRLVSSCSDQHCSIVRIEHFAALLQYLGRLSRTLLHRQPLQPLIFRHISLLFADSPSRFTSQLLSIAPRFDLDPRRAATCKPRNQRSSSVNH